MAPATAKPRDGALVDDVAFADTGCDLAPKCLSCHLPVCRYDMPPGEAQRLSHAVEIRRLADRGWDIARIAQTLHLTTRYVFNVAQAYGARR